MKINFASFKGCRVALVALVVVSANLCAVSAQALPPAEAVRSDGRIKTMVYNENEVYTIIAKNGFHTTLEMDKSEKIETISIGDAVGWQITPSKNRIFVKPLLRTGTTNLSVVTNKREYQFELVAVSEDSRGAEHAYVVKFFYPSQDQFNYDQQDRTRDSLRPISETQIPAIPEVPNAFMPPMGDAGFGGGMPPVPPIPFTPVATPATSGLPPLSSIGIDSYNYNYTLTGPEQYAPQKIYDDGRATYFEFATSPAITPTIAAVMADGSESMLGVNVIDGKYVVDTVAPKFVIRSSGAEQICVFNENMF